MTLSDRGVGIARGRGRIVDVATMVACPLTADAPQCGTPGQAAAVRFVRSAAACGS
jgi:hypothetical protein